MDFQPVQVPCDYRPARFAHPNMKGYWVRLHCLFDGKAVYTFQTVSEQIENGSLINEISGQGSCTLFHYDVLVTPQYHTELYNKIVAYENLSNVSSSD